MIVILMGVTGTGKTTVGHLLAEATGWPFAEGDDYHSAANKQKMHAGIPLTDDDRVPWLASLHAVLRGWYERGESGILACSALKQSYRDTLVAGIPGDAWRFVLLDASPQLIGERLASRKGHYMNPGLLKSQFDTLEMPEDAMRVSVDPGPEQIAASILDALKIPAKPASAKTRA